MKAIVCRSYGPPDMLECRDVPTPEPKQDEVLIRIRAASLNPIDWHLMRGEPYFLRVMAGLRAPKVTRLGVDGAGVVTAVGSGVTDLAIGDEVFGACRGAFAEYACAQARQLAAKPKAVAFEQVAATPVAALTALQGLRDKGRVQAGQWVLVNGASGGVGTFAVQLARTFGAHVTGVCSTKNVALVTGLGADRVVDYTQEDFTTAGCRYDIVVDCVGNHRFAAVRRVLNTNGIHVVIGGASGRWMIGALSGLAGAVMASRFRRHKVVPFVANANRADLSTIAKMIDEGTVVPIIDRRYELADVSDAIRYLEQGHARGKVVVRI